MKKHLLITVTLIPLFFFVACADSMKPENAETLTELKTQNEKFGYAMGSQMARDFIENEAEMDFNAFIQGYEDVMKDGKLLQTPRESQIIQRDAILAIRKKIIEKRKMDAENNKKEGAAFLAMNANKKGIITTESGLQYEVLTEGDGPIPTKKDRVNVNYTGKLLDGTEFDSSYKQGKPATFEVTGVIPGWTEALQLMKTGSKWRLFVPSDLAYKGRGDGSQNIGPNATLIFDIELLGIEAPPMKDEPKKQAAK